MVRDFATEPLRPAHPARVAILPGPTEIGLEIHRSLKDLKEVDLISLGDSDSAVATLLYDEHLGIPRLDDPTWLQQLSGVVSDRGIDILFPAHDDWIVALTRNRDAIPALVVGPPAEMAETLRSKRRTYDLLAGIVPIPRLFSELDDCMFPCFIKPDIGQGSRGAHAVESREALVGYAAFLSISVGELFRRHVVSELLPGAEFSIDCFSSVHGGLLHRAARTRSRTMSGIATSSSPVDSVALHAIASNLDSALGIQGPWFFQAKENAEGDPVVIEVAPRIAGTSGVTRTSGVNLPLLSLYELTGVRTAVLPMASVEGVERFLGARYRSSTTFRRVYVDLDDTLVVRGRINAKLVGLLHQMLGSGASLHLLTRSTGNVQEQLERLRISRLFDEVHVLRDGGPKSRFVEREDAVLIDDSFAERREVHLALGVPTYDLTMLDALVEFG